MLDLLSNILVWYGFGIGANYMGCRYFSGATPTKEDDGFILVMAITGPIAFIPAIIWLLCELQHGK